MKINIFIITLFGMSWSIIGQQIINENVTINGGLKVGNGNSGIIEIQGKGRNDWRINAHNNGTTLFFRTQNDTQEYWTSIPMTLNRLSGNVGIGTMYPGSWKLAVNGKIRAKEIKVETEWSDFVFEEEYDLPTLAEVENYIKERRHLKDIPSAKQVAANGILLGEMNSKLLRKIEELTLYTIKQHKELEKYPT